MPRPSSKGRYGQQIADLLGKVENPANKTGSWTPRESPSERAARNAAAVDRAYRRNQERAARPVKPIPVDPAVSRQWRNARDTIGRAGPMSRMLDALSDDDLSERILKPVRDFAREAAKPNADRSKGGLATKLPYALKPLGKKLDPFGPWGMGADLADDLWDWAMRPPSPMPMVPNPNRGWRLMSYCPAVSSADRISRLVYRSMSNTEYNAWLAAGAVPKQECIGNQSISPDTTFVNRMGFWKAGTGTVIRYSHFRSYGRPNTGGWPAEPDLLPAPPAVLSPLPAFNPNVERALPGLRPSPGMSPPPLAAASVPAPTPRPRQLTGTGSGGFGPRQPFALRQPPGPRRRESKQLARSAQIGRALFEFLDLISEFAEIADAFYDALPKDVKDRWGKGRAPRGLLDQAGQYGIDGADWKLAALWHNWHRVDPQLAFHNLAKNALEDKLVGALQKYRPVNTGQVDQSPRAISDLIDYLFGTPIGVVRS